MQAKRELSKLPHHLWVTMYEENSCLWLQVRLIKTYFCIPTLKENFDELKPRKFVFKLKSETLREGQCFNFQTSETTTFKTALVTKDSYKSTFNVSDMWELSFSLEMTVW
jgi:hypothetical protein